MDDEVVLAIYSGIADITRRMLAAARAAEWDSLIALEKSCSVHFARLMATEDGRPRDGRFQRRKAELIRGVLADDAEIRLLVEPWQAQLAALISHHTHERRLQQAYAAGG